MFYCLEKREEAKTIVEQEMISSGEEKKRSGSVMKKLGEMWKLTTTVEREEFNYKALVDKDRYKQELILREQKIESEEDEEDEEDE